jgi:hypothetical protein
LVPIATTAALTLFMALHLNVTAQSILTRIFRPTRSKASLTRLSPGSASRRRRDGRRRELADGALIRLFPEWKMADIPVYAYFPTGRATRAAGRALVEYLGAKLAGEASST